jgi:hypothetical protein
VKGHMTRVSIAELCKQVAISPEKYIILRNDAAKLRSTILQNYTLKGNVIVLDFLGIESITGSVIDEIILNEYERCPQRLSAEFLGAYIVTNLTDEVYYSIQNELIARLKKKGKSNEFILYMTDIKPAWAIIPDQKLKPFLEPKLKEVLTLIMTRKELTSTKLASLLEGKEDISIKNARIRLEKLYNFRLIQKTPGEAKEFIYHALF